MNNNERAALAANSRASAETLERRLNHINKRLDEGSYSPREANFLLAEKSALNTAITVLTWYAGARDHRETTPLGVLDRLLELDPESSEAVRRLQDDAADMMEGMR